MFPRRSGSREACLDETGAEEGTTGEVLRSRGLARPAAWPQAALSPPGQPGHDRPQERGCGFWTGEGHRCGGLVALGRRARPFSGRRTQSAFGHARLGLVVLYVRRRSTADHANSSGSICTDIPRGEFGGKGSGFGIGVSCHRCSRADPVIKAKSMKARVLNVQGANARMAAMGMRARSRAKAERPLSVQSTGIRGTWGNGQDAPLAILSGHVTALFLVSAVTPRGRGRRLFYSFDGPAGRPASRRPSRQKS